MRNANCWIVEKWQLSWTAIFVGNTLTLSISFKPTNTLHSYNVRVSSGFFVLTLEKLQKPLKSKETLFIVQKN